VNGVYLIQPVAILAAQSGPDARGKRTAPGGQFGQVTIIYRTGHERLGGDSGRSDACRSREPMINDEKHPFSNGFQSCKKIYSDRVGRARSTLSLYVGTSAARSHATSSRPACAVADW